MASCIKCGKVKLRRRKDGLRSCSHCGVSSGHYDRSGTVEIFKVSCGSDADDIQKTMIDEALK